jgi:hypothetical protein
VKQDSLPLHNHAQLDQLALHHSEPFPFKPAPISKFVTLRIANIQNNNELEERSRQYIDSPDLIQRYLYSGTQQIDIMHARATTQGDRAAVQEAKAHRSIIVEHLCNVEKKIGIKGLVRAHLALRIVGALTAAVFLNFPLAVLNFLGALMVIGLAVFNFVSAVSGWIDADLQVYEQLLRVYRSGRTQTTET